MIKYKLLKWLFGWDYIFWSNSYASGVSRVYKSQGGGVLYLKYNNIKFVNVINNADQVTWLTCSYEDYGFIQPEEV